MGQSGERPARRHFIFLLAFATLLTAAGCDGAGSPKSGAKRPTIASLSPAATDILVAIGAQDHLVAVSNYDIGKPAVAGLEGAGDYLTVDWERLAKLGPDVVVVQVREAMAPEGFKRRAATLGVRPVYIHIDTVADIETATRTVGDAVEEPEKVAFAIRTMREKLAAVAASVRGREPVRTLIVTDEGGAGVAGPGTFLDELLTTAGGINAAANEGSAYPGIDREKIIALKPDAVLHLLPDKPARTIEEAKRYWASMPQVPAVKQGRVYFLTEPSIMHPGLGVGDVAGIFADKLHPDRRAGRADGAEISPFPGTPGEGGVRVLRAHTKADPHPYPFPEYREREKSTQVPRT